MHLGGKIMDFSVVDCLPIATAFFKETNYPDKSFEIIYHNSQFDKMFNNTSEEISKNIDFNQTIKSAIKLHREKTSFCYKSLEFIEVQLQYKDGLIVGCFLKKNKTPAIMQFRKIADEDTTGLIFFTDNKKVTFISSYAKQMLNDPDLNEEKNYFNVNLEKIIHIEYSKIDGLQGENKFKLATISNSKGEQLNVEIREVLRTANSEFPLNYYLIRDLSEIVNRDERIEKLKNYDSLTGLYNRTYFEDKINEFNHKKYFPVSIIIGDINGLKLTNDVFGKQRGNQVIITVANIFTMACSEQDIVARYGGDTFIAALPNTTMDDAKKTASKITELCNLETNGSTKLSVSIGYSCKEDLKKSFESMINNAEDVMCRNKMVEVQSYRSSFIAALKSTLYEKSYETEKHCLRICELCKKIGEEMKLSQIEMNDLILFSMLHDIGKIGIDDSILGKPDKLTEQEWIEMKKHSYIGYSIARSSPELENIAYYILCHHERYDGTGYPNGLKGEDIPLLSRILSVVDSYDAMVNDRCYRKALPQNVAIAEIKKNSGTQFDPHAVECFLKVLSNDKTTK